MLHFSKVAGAALLATCIDDWRCLSPRRSCARRHASGRHPTVEAVKYFGELIKAHARRLVEVYHSAQLGQEADTIEQVRSGMIE